jgi:hypothetical protein
MKKVVFETLALRDTLLGRAPRHVGFNGLSKRRAKSGQRFSQQAMRFPKTEA